MLVAFVYASVVALFDSVEKCERVYEGKNMVQMVCHMIVGGFGGGLRGVVTGMESDMLIWKPRWMCK